MADDDFSVIASTNEVFPLRLDQIHEALNNEQLTFTGVVQINFTNLLNRDDHTQNWASPWRYFNSFLPFFRYVALCTIREAPFHPANIAIREARNRQDFHVQNPNEMIGRMNLSDEEQARVHNAAEQFLTYVQGYQTLNNHDPVHRSGYLIIRKGDRVCFINVTSTSRFNQDETYSTVIDATANFMQGPFVAPPMDPIDPLVQRLLALMHF